MSRTSSRIWRTLRGELAREKLHVVELEGRDLQADREGWRRSSLSQLFPVLTPLAIDPAHPFPFMPNLAFALALKLKRLSDGKSFFALVPMPNVRCAGSGSCSPGEAPEALQDGGAALRAAGDPGRPVPRPPVPRMRGGQAQGVFQIIRDSDVELEEEAEDLVREFEAVAAPAPPGLGGAHRARGLHARGAART